MLGALYATNIAGYSPFGMEGWRVAFRSVAVAAFFIGFWVLYWVVDPRHTHKTPAETSTLPPPAHPGRDSRNVAVARPVQGQSWQEVVADFWAVCPFQPLHRAMPLTYGASGLAYANDNTLHTPRAIRSTCS